jgi:hypothetical protein
VLGVVLARKAGYAVVDLDLPSLLWYQAISEPSDAIHGHLPAFGLLQIDGATTTPKPDDDE